MNYLTERAENIPCGNRKCQFWKSELEVQNCDAESGGEHAVASCKVYFPDLEIPNCLLCEKKIESSHIDKDLYKGVVEKVSLGFGSIHDGDIYHIAICDDCLTKLKDENKIILLGNYIV